MKQPRCNSKGVSAHHDRSKVNITDDDDLVRVAPDSLEANLGYNCLLRQLQNACIERVAYYRSKKGGALTEVEAWAIVYGREPDSDTTHEIYDEIKSYPVNRISFLDLARMWRVDPHFAQALWEMLKQEASEEFESGHLASQSMTPSQFIRTAWTVASYLALRECFIKDWKPHGAVELSLLDMLAQTYLLFQYWLKESIKRSQTEPRRSNQGYIQWQQLMNDDEEPDSGFTYGHWDVPYVSEQQAIEQATLMADRWHRTYIRTLRNLRDLRRYNVTINNAQQVNIATDGGPQTNVSCGHNADVEH
jgi:hypothetical protein